MDSSSSSSSSSSQGFGRRPFLGGVFAAAGGTVLGQESKSQAVPDLFRNPSVYHFSDLSHHHGLMLHNPNWTIDPVQSVETRKKVFSRAASEKTRSDGFHMPWPGLGQILPVGEGYLWHPERWSWAS
jgi:hypothetical protein